MPETGAGHKAGDFHSLQSEELKEILLAHAAFLAKTGKGRRAMLPFHDLTKLDLSGINLSEADLTGAKLTESNLDHAQLRRANLFCADLRLCRLTYADLSLTDLRGAAMRGADNALQSVAASSKSLRD